MRCARNNQQQMQNKLDPMFADIIRIRIRAFIGIWRQVKRV